MTNWRKPDQRIALVTGASRGIGRAIALRLAADGAAVIVHYGGNEAAAAETVRLIEAQGGSAFAIGHAFGDLHTIEALFAQVDSELESRTGARSFDILVNNAAIALDGSLDEVTVDDYERQLTVNASSPFFTTQHAARRLNDGGRIITISSDTCARAHPEWLVYTMTKSAIEAMTRIVAQDLAARHITVNAVRAGIVDTDMSADLKDNPEILAEAAAIAALGGIAQPADIADVVGFLAADDARWVTGQVIAASGGSFL